MKLILVLLSIALVIYTVYELRGKVKELKSSSYKMIHIALAIFFAIVLIGTVNTISNRDKEIEKIKREIANVTLEYNKLDEKVAVAKNYLDLTEFELKEVNTKIEEVKKATKEKEEEAKKAEEERKKAALALANKSYSGISNVSVKDVLSGSGERIGKRGYAVFNPDTITETSLFEFYNEKIKDSGYNYYTLVNLKDRTKGIVFAGCYAGATYGDIDNTGGICSGDGDIEVTSTGITYTSR